MKPALILNKSPTAMSAIAATVRLSCSLGYQIRIGGSVEVFISCALCSTMLQTAGGATSRSLLLRIGHTTTTCPSSPGLPLQAWQDCVPLHGPSLHSALLSDKGKEQFSSILAVLARWHPRGTRAERTFVDDGSNVIIFISLKSGPRDWFW